MVSIHRINLSVTEAYSCEVPVNDWLHVLHTCLLQEYHRNLHSMGITYTDGQWDVSRTLSITSFTRASLDEFEGTVNAHT